MWSINTKSKHARTRASRSLPKRNRTTSDVTERIATVNKYGFLQYPAIGKKSERSPKPGLKAHGRKMTPVMISIVGASRPNSLSAILPVFSTMEKKKPFTRCCAVLRCVKFQFIT